MTPEQRELLLKTQMCNFRYTDGWYVFQTYSTFPFYEYERKFTTLEGALEHAKFVLTECGGNWEDHPGAEGLVPWITQHVVDTGGTIEFVTDPEKLRVFMRANGTEQAFFADLHKVMRDNKANKET